MPRSVEARIAEEFAGEQARHSGVNAVERPHEVVLSDTDLEDVEETPVPEAEIARYESLAERPEYLARNAEYGKGLEANISTQLADILRHRAEQGDELADKQIRAYETLRTGRVLYTNEQLAKHGVNQVRRCVVVGHDSTIYAYAKPAIGGFEMFAGKDGTAYLVSRRYENEQLIRKLTRESLAKRFGLTEEMLESRANSADPDNIFRRISAYYGIDATRLPIRKNPFSIRSNDTFHEPRAATASFISSAYLGFDRIPETATRKVGNDLHSIQRGISGVTGRELRNGLIDHPKDHLFLEPMLETACLHFLHGETDGTMNNHIGPNSIDNGLTFQYAVDSREFAPEYPYAHPAEMTLPGLPYYSLSWDAISRRPDLILPDHVRSRFASIVEEFNAACAIAQGQYSKEKITRLPARLRNGETATFITSLFRFIHQRVDEKGTLIPETRAVAMRDAATYVSKLDYLASHGRPPSLPYPLRRISKAFEDTFA